MSHGYRVVRVDGKQMLEHRKVMEDYLGRKLLPTEIVHHKELRTNNVPELLQVVSAAEHRKIHTKLATHCRNKHEYTTETAYTGKDGYRRCRSCDQERYQRKRIRHRG